VDLLIGDPAKAEEELQWTRRTSFRDLVTMMVDADLALLNGDLDALHRR
jgi:GDPmannose 4,6-dehydratase